MKKFYLGPKFGTLIDRKWITNIWVVTRSNLHLNGFSSKIIWYMATGREN
jgi:hypothetical protein